MKKENCPFCGHRWTRSSLESPVICPNCNSKYYIKEKLTDNNTFSEENQEEECL